MIFNNEQIQEILSLVDFRFADLVWKIFGPSHLTSQDKENLKKHGIDPGSLVKKIPPYWANWMFGLLSGKLSDYQTKQISYKDLLDYLARRQYETPSKREIEEYEMACNRTYGHLKGLGDKMKKDISSYISDSELRMRMEQERTIKEGVKRGIVERDTTKLIAAKISNQLNDWSRDWNRIVETEYQGVFNMGRVQSYMREGDGSNTLIYFDVYPAACRHCIRLYLTAGIGSEPKLFTAEELIGNGTNIGRRVADWKPTIITAVHPFCYDDKVEVLTNKGWKFFKDLDKTELFLSINPETGEVLTVVDEYGNIYTNRPDTGFPLIGFMVPYWKEANETAKKLALHNTDIHYASLDLASSASFAKPSASLIAMSERILRFISTPACFKPYMNLL